MALVESLQRAIDYMEEHLLDQISIEGIAKQANLSTYHFQRIFTILTDMSVGEYLRRRRLTLAAQQLSSANCKVIDLAYKYGYDTPESFSKAFRKQHGVTPSEMRKGIGKTQAYNRLVIQVNLKGAEPMEYRIVEKDAFQVVGVKRELACSADGASPAPAIGQFWAELNGNGTVNQLTQLINGDIKGALGITANYDEEKNVIDYWIGVERHGDVPEGFSSTEVPASKWAVFGVRGPVMDAMPQTWKKIYSEWFPSNTYEHTGAASLEVYTDADPTKPDAHSEIWVPIK